MSPRRLGVVLAHRRLLRAPRRRGGRAGRPASTRGGRRAPTPTTAKATRRNERAARANRSGPSCRSRRLPISGPATTIGAASWVRPASIASFRIAGSLAEPVEVGQQLLLADEQRVALGRPAARCRSRSPRRGRSGRARRTPAGTRGRCRRGRTPGGSSGDAARTAPRTPAAGQRRRRRRRATRWGRNGGAGAGARVDRHLLADREAEPRRARVEEGERVGLRATTPKPSSSSSVGVGWWRRLPSRSWTSCWRRPYDRRRLDWWRLLTVTPPLVPVAGRWAVRRRGARRPAGGRSGRAGWRRSRRPSGSATAGSRGAAAGSGRRRRPAARAGRRSPAARRRGSA